jgi:hypothetical protein
MPGALMLSAKYLLQFASLVPNLCWGLSMAYALRVSIGLSAVERVGLDIVPVIPNGYEICVISAKMRELPFSISNGEAVLLKLVDAYLMAELGTNFLKSLW